jgi:5-methylthioadenosine/S-adenosylhomocysteine deaminase
MDTSVWWSGDLFSAMRTTLGADRSREHLEAHRKAETVTHLHLRAEQVVEWATRGGSKALGLDSVVGSLESGKKADIVLIKNDDSPVMFPIINPYGHVAFQAQRADVDTVMVNGRLVKRDHKLVGTDLAAARRKIEATIEYLVGAMGQEAWDKGMYPDIPETKVMDNPYQYTEWDAGSAQWKH